MTPTYTRSGGTVGVWTPTSTVEGSTMPMIVGRFATFDRWTTIEDRSGSFLEKISPGAFSRSINEDGAERPNSF
jgi:phage head maturation protease